MSNFSDYIPLNPNQSTLSLDTPNTPQVPSPDAFISPAGNNRPVVDNSQSSFGDYIDAPTLQEKMAPVTFDWKETKAGRFTQDRHFRTEGFNPYATPEIIDGKTYDANELKYAGVQTWNDVMSNAVGGSWALAKNTFIEAWKGWADVGNAFRTIGTDESFMQALAGSPEEMMQKDEEQKAIFDKYAIFKSPVHESNFGIFNREFVGDMIQQSGFSIGAGAQFLSEMALTWGIGEAFGAVAKGAGWLAKGIAATEESKAALTMLERSKQFASKGKVVNDARKIADPTSLKDYGKKILAWAGDQLTDVTGIKKMTQAYEAGASSYQLAAMGVGGVTRFGAALNSAMTEARFEAAGVYGQMYADHIDKWQEEHNGELPVGEDLERIRKTAYATGVDVFGANTALILAFNQLEFGNIINKFGSSSRLMREALEQGEGELFSVAGKLKRDIPGMAGAAGLKEGQKASQAYLKGTFGALSNFNTIRKDFGLGTALYQVGKRGSRIETLEGIQEMLQSATSETFTDYYNNLYNGGKDIEGNSFLKDLTSADWGKGLQSQLSMEGWQTFVMGAATGLFISPIQSGVMAGFKKANAAVNKQYQGEADAHKKVMEDNLKVLNTWYNDPTKALNEHINGLKVQGQVDKNMQEALENRDKYQYQNAKDDAFTNAVSVAIKTGNYESLVDSIKEMGDRLTDEQFEQAFGLQSTSENKINAKSFTANIVKDIEKYYDTWQNLKDKFAHTIQPELYDKDSAAFKNAKLAKKVLDDAIETLATTSHHATKTIERATEIRAKASALPGIGLSANKAFELLGNVENAADEVQRLKAELKTLEALKGDKLIDGQIASNKEQTKHLEEWLFSFVQLENIRKNNVKPVPFIDSRADRYRVQERLKAASAGYITAINSQYDKSTPVIDRDQLNEIFNLLMDYNTLNRDHGQYVQALNVITDPRAFALMYQKMMDGAAAAIAAMKKQHIKEAKKRAAAAVGNVAAQEQEDKDEEEDDDDDNKKEGDKKEGETGDGIDESILPTKVKAELITYYGEPEYIATEPGSYVPNPNRVLSTEAEAWLNKNDKLMNKLDTVYTNNQKVKSPKSKVLSESEVIAIIKEHFDAEKPESEEEKVKRLAKEKAIAYAAEKKRLQAEWAKELDDIKEEINERYKQAIIDAGDDADKKTLLRAEWAKELKDDTKKTAIDAKYTKLIADLDIKAAGGKTTSDIAAERLEIEFAIKQLEDAFQVRVDNFISKGATKEEAEELAKKETPQDDKDALVSLKSKLANLGKEPVSDIDAKIADIERRRQEEKDKLSAEYGDVIPYTHQKFKDIDAKYDAELAALDKEKEAGTKTSLEGLPKMKMLDSQLSIGAHRLEDIKGGYVDTKEQAEKRLANTLAPLSQEDLDEGLSLVVTERPAGEAKQLLPGNEVIYSQPQKYSMQLRYNGEPIGYLTNAGFYVFKIDGKELTPLQLSVEQFEKLIKPSANMSPLEALTQFQEDFKIATTIQLAIEKQLAEGKNTFSGTELQELVSIRPVITLDFVNAEDSRTAPLLEDINANTNIPVTESGEKRMIVVNNARYKEAADKLKATGEFETVSSSEYAPMVLGEMGDLDSPALQSAGPVPITDKEGKEYPLGMYSVAVEVAGQVKWIQVTPTVYDEVQMQATLDRIKEIASKEEKERTEKDNQEISSLLKGIFIALPTHIWIDGIKVGEDKFQKWDLRLNYNAKENRIFVSTNKDGVPPLNLGTAKFNSPEELAAAIQKEISKEKTEKGVKKALFPGITVTKENFRHQVPFSTSIEEKRNAILGMTASVYSNVAKRISLRYGLPKEVIASTLPEESAPGVSENIVPTAVEEVVPVAKTRKNRKKNDEKAAEDVDFGPMKKGKKVKKLVPKGKVFDEKSVENIQKFIAWVKKNLPEGIFSVDDLSRIEEGLNNNYETVGQFVAFLDELKNIKGSIQVRDGSPFKYHEAFHGVFRLLLSQDKINELLAQAKKENRATAAKLKELRESDPIYRDMSEQELEERFYEEYMADKFDAWKMDRSARTSGTIKAFFQKLLDIIKYIFAKISGNKLQAMFYELEKGKYKNAGLQVNSFTDKVQEGISDPALKLILLEEGFEIETENGVREVNRYLDQSTGDQLSTNIAALYHKMTMLEPTHNKKELLTKILNMYKDTYDTDRPIYKSRARAIEDIPKRAEWMRKLVDLETVFTEDASRKSLMEAVDLHLQIMGYKQDLDDEEVASLEDEVGPRNTEDAHKKTKSPLSDYASLSKYLREYIGSTTYQLEKDEFGNTSLLDGTALYNTVNANKVYNGLLAILSNVADEDRLLDKMIEYTKHQGNPETVKFINRLFEDTGFDRDTKVATKNTLLLQQVIKGFNQYSTQYLFTQINQNNQFQTSYANTKDAARVQFSNWKAQYDSLKAVKTFAVGKLVNKMINNETKIKVTELDNFCAMISAQLEEETGIALHEMFIKFSIIASKKEEARYPEQQEFYDLYSNVEPIATSALVANLQTPLTKTEKDSEGRIKVVDIFAKDADTEEGEKVNTSKPHQFLMKIAASNALFDESINTISFTNANNETVYAHQLPNFDFVKVRELNDKDVRQALMENPEFANFLLSDPKFVAMANRNKLSVEQIDGLRKVFESTNDETGETFISKNLEVNRQPGVTYGDFNKRELFATLLGFYDIRKQPDALVRNDNNTEKWYVVPVMTRTIEAKNSAHIVRMAVIPSVTKVKGGLSLTKEAMDKLYEFIKTEHNNIKQAKKEIEEINNGTYTGKVIKGYHTGKKNDDGTWKVAPRGLRFFNGRVSLGALAEEIENNPDAELNETKIKQQLNNYWLSQADVLASQMAVEGLITLKKEAGKIVKIGNILAPNFIFEGYGSNELNDAMNINNTDAMFNLTQILINDYINTVAINQLMLGNEAKSFKDPIDQVKRMAGANAQGPSMSTSFVSKELGIDHALKTIHHITYSDNEGIVRSSVSGNEIQGDDGQMYGTAKGLRYALFGFGKLTKVQADIITKLQEGVPVTEKEFFEAGGLKDKGAFNSLKLVYYNGSTYLKCSMIPLFREMVSVWDGDEWQPQIGKEAAHNLLNKMEDYENGYGKDANGRYILDENGERKIVHPPTVVFAHPESVSKGLKANIANSISEIDDTHFNPLESRFMRQQLENPSNKLTITDPSQAKQQIMSEQDDNTPVIFMGVETTVGKVRAAYMANNSQRVKNNYKGTANSIFTLKDAMIELDQSIKGKEFTARMGEFFDTMKETLRATGADQQTLNFLETKDGKPIYNLNFPSTLEKFTSIFLNYFSKGSVAEKVPGHTLALVSGSLGLGDCLKRVISVDENGQPKEWEVIPRAEYLKNFRKYKDAKRWDDATARTFVGLKEGDFYLDSLRHNVPIYDKDNKIVGRFSEYMAPAHYKEEMYGIPTSMRDAFGIRIPSDDKHSYISLRKVDTLPVQYGSVGIFPHELVEISGADFDIDKMYLSIADTYSVEETESVAAKRYKNVKDIIASHYERMAELSRQFETTDEYSPAIAQRGKEIKKEIKQLELDYKSGKISWDEYNTTAEELILEKEGLGTEKGKEQRGPIEREMKSIAKTIKSYKKELEELKEKLAKSATRVAYGSRTSRQGEFDEFIKWQEANNKVFKKRVKELKSLYNSKLDDFGDIGSDILADLEDINEMFNLDSDALLYKTALKELGLPADPIEYYNASYNKEGIKVVELNNGVLNNRSLAAKLAMQSNEDIVKINSTSTSTKPLLTLTEKLIKMFTAISEDEKISYDKKKGVAAILNVLQETPTDVSSIIGKVVASDNNKQGSRNIGATANAIQVYSLNNQFNVNIEEGFAITIDGNTFTSFSHNKEWEAHEAEPVLYKTGKKKGEIKGYIIAGEEYSKKDFDQNTVPKGAYTGTRIAANLGTLLNAMTDNAKERLAARLGLNITALGYVSNMVGTGVPLETAVLLVLQPAARRYFADIQKLEGSLKTEDEKNSSKRKILSGKIDALDPKDDVNVGHDNDKTTQDLIDNIAQGGSKYMDAWALKVIKLVEAQSDTLASISKIQKLSQGLPTTWEDVDVINTALNNLGIKLDGDRYVEMTEDELKKYKEENKVEIAVDVKDILLNRQEIIATNLKVLAQVQYLSKKVFIEKTPLFARLYEVVFANMKKMSNIETTEFGKTLKHDIISFLSIKAYMHWLTKNDYPGTLTSLSNAMIYPELKSQKPVGYKDIVDVVKSLRDKLKGKNENYLVSRFLMAVSADNSKEGINTAEANTWARLSDAQQDKLVSSFISLYVNAYADKNGNEINTHDDAVAMFNYLLVKDGAQFKSGSFIRFIPTFMFEDIMGRTTEVNDFLADDKWDEEKALSIFGVSSVNIMDELMRSYATHVGNKFYIKSILDKKGLASLEKVPMDKLTDAERKKVVEHISTKEYTKPVDINPSEQPLIYIDMFRGIRDTVVPDMEGTYVNRRYGKDFTDYENALLVKNKNYIEASGFKIITKGTKNKIEFPYSIKVNGELYELFALGESIENAPTKVITRDVSVATGTTAQYRKTEWKGAPSTFKASAIDGPLPVSKIQVSKKTKTVIETEGEEEVTEEYLAQIEAEEAARQSTKTPEERLAEFGIIRIATSKGFVAVKGGKQYLLNADENTPAKIIARVQAEEAAVSLQPMKQGDLFAQATEAPVPGVESIPNTGITVKQGNEFIDLIQPQIAKQAYVENKARTANMMFSFGLRWAKNIPNESEKSEQAKNVGKPRPDRKPIKSKEGVTYGYYLTDQNNNPLPSVKELQPIIDFIQSKLAIDMSDYDAVLGNIYDENSFIHQHRDTTESVTAEGYPVIVINLGADGHLAYDEDVKSTYPTWKKTGQLDLSNGGIYAFGVDGVNRFTFHHRIGQGLESANPLKPITLPDGTTLKNYRITLTFRRASDLEKGMPATPKKLSTTQGTQAPVSETNVSLPTGEQMSEERWDRILSNMGKGKAQKIDALAYRDGRRKAGETDATILEEIKACK